MIVKWIVCYWLCCPVGCLIIFLFCELALSYFGKAAPCSLKPIYMHSSEKLPAVNLTSQQPPESVEGTGFIVVNQFVLCRSTLPKGNHSRWRSYSSALTLAKTCACEV